MVNERYRPLRDIRPYQRDRVSKHLSQKGPVLVNQKGVFFSICTVELSNTLKHTRGD